MAISHTMQPRRWSLNGQCVYCGNKFPLDELTDEHIVPLTLNGDWIIVKGACNTCASKSNKLYENKALQSDTIRVPRAILDLKRRRAQKKGPIEMPPIFPYGTAAQTSVDLSEYRKVEIADYPPYFVMPIIEPAAILGASYKTRVKPDRRKLKLWLRYIE
jgi:HNH endonuclease